MIHRMNACRFNAVTHGILIGVISFTAGAVLMVGIGSVWFHGAAAAADGEPSVRRTCRTGQDDPFPSDPAGRTPVPADAPAIVGPGKI